MDRGQVDWTELVNANRGKIFAVLLRMSANYDDAEELTQETFLQAWRKWHTFKGDSKVSTWLYRMAVNIFLMNHRGQQRTFDRTMVHDDLDDSLARRYTSELKHVALTRAIARLPRGYRKSIILHDILGMSHREVAKKTRKSIGNTKSQLWKARKSMREILIKGA